MANNIVQLTDDSGNDVFPIAGGMANDSVTKAMLAEGVFEGDVLSTPTDVDYVSTNNIQDGAVTNAKIANNAVKSQNVDFTTLSFSDNGVTYNAFGKLVFGNIIFSPSSPVSMTNYDANPYLLTTLDLAPLSTISVPCWAMNSSNGAIGQHLIVFIEPNGRVYIRNFTSTTVSISRLRAGFSFVAS